MERNQNGYPTPRTDISEPRSGGCTAGGSCGGENLSMNDLPLAYAYIPVQKWRMLYSPEDALVRGTMFEELDKPKEVYGREW